MRHQTGSLSGVDGVKLFTQSWVPDAPRAAVILAHGYAEHSQRYAAFAEALSAERFAVHALDHRGHGRSEGARANIRVFREFVSDLSRFIGAVREQRPTLPRFLFGHSMGGVVAAQLVLEHPHQCDGLILSAPFLQNAQPVAPALLAVSGLASRLTPGLPTIKLDAGLMSRDQNVVTAYRSDPLIYTGGLKARIGAEMLSAGQYVLGRAQSVTLPLLVLHGTADGIAAVEGSEQFYRAAASEDKTFKTYEGFYHEALNDIGKEEVVADVLTWLRAHLPVD